MIKEWERKKTFLEIARFQSTGIVPGRVVILGSIWDENPEYFEKLRERTLNVQISIDRNPQREKENFYKDKWGCLWHYPGRYLDGQVVEHPLDSWSKFREFRLPDPNGYIDWQAAKERIDRVKREGRVAFGSIEHGFLYLRLEYLRGFENFIIDVAEKRKELKELISLITSFWCEMVKRWLSLGVDGISFGDDLGHQRSLPISPRDWRALIKPAYTQIFSLCREKGIEVYLHTDGYIVEIIRDLIECGVTILNPQDLVNGLDNLERLAKSRVCIDLDIDRQKITAFGKPEDIRQHIQRCVQKLGSPQGGLMLLFGAYPGTPKENICAVVEAMEKYYDWWLYHRQKQGGYER